MNNLLPSPETITFAALWAIVGGAVAIGLWAGTTRGELVEHGNRLDNQHQRLERMESAVPLIREDLAEIKTDLRYLRRAWSAGRL